MLKGELNEEKSIFYLPIYQWFYSFTSNSSNKFALTLTN